MNDYHLQFLLHPLKFRKELTHDINDWWDLFKNAALPMKACFIELRTKKSVQIQQEKNIFVDMSVNMVSIIHMQSFVVTLHFDPW